MPLLSSLLFGLAASLDAFLVGMTYGIRKIRIPLRQNLLISLITLAGTCLSVLLGNWLLPLLPGYTARIIGSCILMLLGLYYLLKSMLQLLKKYHNSKNPDTSASTRTCDFISSEETLCNTTPFAPDTSANTDLSTLEAYVLGITLSLNNMGIGFSASITGLPLLSTSIVTLLFSIVFLLTGNRLGGCRLLQFTKKAADPVSGLLLIILGICQLTL